MSGAEEGSGEGAAVQAGCLQRTKKQYSIVTFLISGTMSVVVNKILYGIEAPGAKGSAPHRFEKPWFTNWAMFLGMTLCLVGFEVTRAIKKVRGKPTPHTPRKLYWAIAIPALCDMVASFLMGVGLLWIPGSVWQMLRGSIIIFTAILKVTYRKKRLLPAEILGICIVVVGIAVVGFSSFLTPGEVEDANGAANASSSSLLLSDSSVSSVSQASQAAEGMPKALKISLGILLVVLAQALQATQTIVEEKLLHDVDAPATLIVGMEGLYGLLLCSCISMPIAYFLPGEEGQGLHEDTLDSFAMIGYSQVLLWVCVLYVLVILVFNLFGMMITQVTDAMVRNIMEPIRTLLVWVTMVFICYVCTHKRMGERVNYWSLLQLAGFVTLSIGVLIYNDVISCKCLRPAASSEQEPLIVNGNSKDDKEQP